MATTTRRNSSKKDTGNKSRPNGNGRRRPEPEDYEETPGWGTAFHRPDAEGSQPSYTGTGVIDIETLREIANANGEIQIAIWPRRAKTGTKMLRFHIEPPYAGGTESDELDDDEFAGGDDQEQDDDEETPF